jgi:hypothetical protein
VRVIIEKRPSVAAHAAIRKKIPKALNEILAVTLIPEDLSPLYAADDHMVQNTGRIQSS